MATTPRDPKPVIAGVLDFIAGAMSLVGGGVLAVIGVAGTGAMGMSGDQDAARMAFVPLAVFIPLAALCFVVGLVAVIGGVAALKRRRLGLAVAGAIAALFAFFPFGIPAIILTILSEKEFRRS